MIIWWSCKLKQICIVSKTASLQRVLLLVCLYCTVYMYHCDTKFDVLFLQRPLHGSLSQFINKFTWMWSKQLEHKDDTYVPDYKAFIRRSLIQISFLGSLCSQRSSIRCAGLQASSFKLCATCQVRLPLRRWELTPCNLIRRHLMIMHPYVKDQVSSYKQVSIQLEMRNSYIPLRLTCYICPVLHRNNIITVPASLKTLSFSWPSV